MEVAEVYSELTGKGLHLVTHEGKIRVWPKEKLTKKDRELLKAYKEELLVLPFLKKGHLGGELGERCEPNFKVFSREKGYTDAGYMSFPENKDETNVHNVHYVHSSSSEGTETNVHNVHDVHPQDNYELRQLGAWYFSEGPSGFDPHGDYSEYDTGTHQSALRMLNLVRDLTWPDFEVYVDGSLITLKRIREKYFPRRSTLEWKRFVDWWENLGSYPPPGTSFETCSEEVAQEIVDKWNGIAKKVNKEFLKDFNKYHIQAYQEQVFVSQTRFIPGGPSQDELNSLKADAVAKLETDAGVSRITAEGLVGSR